MADNLQTARESRTVIDQARDVPIERYKHTPDQAFQLLAQASMNADHKVRYIADHLVHTGELPAASSQGSSRRRGTSRNPARPQPEPREHS